MTLARSRALTLAALVLAAACSNDHLATPSAASYAGGAMFLRYVALGNSITSGYQSGGITDSTQRQAYPVILAAAMGGDPFYSPSLAGVGCPPPYTNIFTQTRLGVGSTATTCFFRSSPTPPYISDVAVPGAYVIDLYTNGSGTNSNALTQLFLGGRTQVQAMADAKPTFVSVWIGNNDVLDALLSTTNAGDSTLITPLATFQTEYQQVAADVKATGAQAILIGVANVTEVPYASFGSVYFAIKNKLIPGDSFPTTFAVGLNCAPSTFGGKGDSVLVPFPFGGALSPGRAGGCAGYVALHGDPDRPARRVAQARGDGSGLQFVHPQHGQRQQLGVLGPQPDARLAARQRWAGRPVPRLRRPVLRVAVRPRVLLRRLPSQRRHPPAHRAPPRPGDQREIRLGDPRSLSGA